MRAQELMDAAELHRMKGEVRKARSLWKQIVADFPDTAQGAYANDQLRQHPSEKCNVIAEAWKGQRARRGLLALSRASNCWALCCCPCCAGVRPYRTSTVHPYCRRSLGSVPSLDHARTVALRSQRITDVWSACPNLCAVGMDSASACGGVLFTLPLRGSMNEGAHGAV